MDRKKAAGAFIKAKTFNSAKAEKTLLPQVTLLIAIIAISAFIIKASAQPQETDQANPNLHSAGSILIPTLVKGGATNLFHIDVVNGNSSNDSIFEFRIYLNPEFTDYNCQPAIGWNGPVVMSGALGQFCQYAANTSNNSISPGENKNFTFIAKSPNNQSCRDFKFETRDPNQFFSSFSVQVCVDTTTGATAKTFIGPQKTENGVEWISDKTLVNLSSANATAIFWRNTLIDDSFCFQPQICSRQAMNITLKNFTIEGLLASADTNADQDNPNTNFGSNPWLMIRSFRSQAELPAHPNNARAFIKFDLSSIPPGSIITSAKINLHMDIPSNSSRIHGLKRVTEDWSEMALTWNNQPSVNGVTSSNETGIDVDKKISFDVTSDVQGIVNGNFDNKGWGISDASENASFPQNVMYTSREHEKTFERPTLDIIYAIMEAPPFNNFTDPFQKKDQSCHLLEFFSVDSAGNMENASVNCFFVDGTPPTVNKTIGEPKFVQEGGVICTNQSNASLNVSVNESQNVTVPTPPNVTCQNVTTRVFITNNTPITLTCRDVEPHPVGNVSLFYRSRVSNDCTTWGEWGSWAASNTSNSSSEIRFETDSCHALEFFCKDGLNNTGPVLSEIDIVDSKPPVTAKILGVPKLVVNSTEFITKNTTITLNATDLEPHPSGVNSTFWRNTIVDNSFCLQPQTCSNANGSGSWNIYTGPFKKENESCHLLEFFSSDNLMNNETVNKECMFVAESHAGLNKTIGEPNSRWDGRDAKFYNISNRCWNSNSSDSIECWKVVLSTPISIMCNSALGQSPEPLQENMACVNIELDGSDITQSYCSQLGGNLNESGDGFCCVGNGIGNFSFKEISEHNLKVYCIEGIEKGAIDEEKFKVEEVGFTIKINKKWNLISVPVNLLDNSINGVFKNANGKVTSVWSFNGTDWSVFSPDNNSLNDNLNTMVPGMGYWALSNDDLFVVVGGSLISPAETPPSTPVVSGWNLVGYYGNDGLEVFDGPFGNGKEASCAINTLGDSIWDKGFTSLWSYWEPFNPDVWIKLNKTSKMDPGAGYWLFAQQAGIYAPSTTCGVVE